MNIKRATFLATHITKQVVNSMMKTRVQDAFKVEVTPQMVINADRVWKERQGIPHVTSVVVNKGDTNAAEIRSTST
jgi:hypothetical protein